MESKGFLSLLNVHKYEENKRRRDRIDYFIEQFLQEMYASASPETKQEYDDSIQSLLEEVKACPNPTLGKTQELIIKVLAEKFRTGEAKVDVEELVELGRKLDREEFMVIKEEVEDMGVDQIKKCDKVLEGEEEEIKAKLGRDFPIRPPEFAHDIPGFGSKQCYFCKGNSREAMCLICGFVLCNRCEGSQKHKKYHQNKMLTFIYNEATVKCEDPNRSPYNPGLFGGGNSRSEEFNVYFTDLMVPFKDRNPRMHRKETFKLNEAIFAKYTNN